MKLVYPRAADSATSGASQLALSLASVALMVGDRNDPDARTGAFERTRTVLVDVSGDFPESPFLFCFRRLPAQWLHSELRESQAGRFRQPSVPLLGDPARLPAFRASAGFDNELPRAHLEAAADQPESGHRQADAARLAHRAILA